MKIKLFFIRFYVLITGALLMSYSSSAQSIPFYCDFNAYLFQTNDVYALDLASGSSYLVASDITTGNVNAAGYNPADGYIWAALSSPSRTIARIGKNFQVDTFHIPQLPSSNSYVGDVDSLGNYFLKGGGDLYYKIDLNPSSTNYTKYIKTDTLSTSLSIHDWAFNAVDGQLYTVEKNTNNLYRINSNTGLATNLGTIPILSGLNYTYGAVYFDSTGRFYVSANQTGTIYIVYNVQGLSYGDSIQSNCFAFGPASSQNDGARCPTAPVPQEDCINGIDDDGDGLIDCNDPSCSGVATCPVISPPVTGGSGGGLESNDRLSQQINQRNYLRGKTNYVFNKEEAPRLIKSSDYKQKSTARANFTLRELIPLGVIEGATAIESSPSDLVAITNATELISVDYMKNDEPVAVILATKTENGVYEHTKYICDRLLGAELLSVSTMLIKDQPFIKSIIKNSDGSVEFVLSFSGKLVNNGNNFSIESHWNIDKYEDSVPFYNFQIWSNKIDDLLLLGEEALELFDIQKPIISYNNSNPPPVFVKKGTYRNGALELEMVNTSNSKKIWFDAGFKRTETSETEHSSTEIDLESGYLSSLILETGNLFDIGFRIRNDRNETSDDLFLSDGPWGVDESAIGTTLDFYQVEENETRYEGEGIRMERNVNLKATTSEYVAIYKAFTPRFKSIDLSGFNTVTFEASGVGEMDITIIQEGIKGWESQFKTTINLTREVKKYELPYQLFSSINGGKMNLRDAVSIVFTLSSNGGTKTEKKLQLKDLEFTYNKGVANDENQVVVAPNPMESTSQVYFFSTEELPCNIQIFNTSGTLVYTQTSETKLGNNEVRINKGNLSPGLYFLTVKTETTQYKTVKLVVN